MAENYTLLDFSKQFNNEGKAYEVTKLLVQNNPILQDALIIESNNINGHEYAVQNGLPAVAFRRAYKGIKPSKGSQTPVFETYGILSAMSSVDQIVAEKGGKVKEVRAAMAEDILEAMSQKQAEEMIYGSDKVESFIGLAARYSKTSSDKTKSGHNVILNSTYATAAAASANTSIYIIGWGARKIYTFFPQGTKAGIDNHDFGLVKTSDSAGGTFPSYDEIFTLRLGLAVQDWRYGARLANIDCSDTVDSTKNNTLRINLMRAINRLHSRNGVKPVIYCNKAVAEMLQMAVDAKSYVNWTPENPNAQPVLNFSGIPVHVCDCIKSDETAIQ